MKLSHARPPALVDERARIMNCAPHCPKPWHQRVPLGGTVATWVGSELKRLRNQV